MIRRIAIAGVIAALLVPLSAPPAGAGPSPSPPAGCAGDGCSILLSQLILLNGDRLPDGADSGRIAVDPPPCLWEPFGDAVTGSRRVATESNLLAALPSGSNPLGLADAVREAKHLLSIHAPPSAGTWFELVGNPAAGAETVACLNLPLFDFVPQGQAPRTLPIPPRTLAEFAYNHMLIPAPAITTNPADKGFVNLGTYVWGSWANSPTTGVMNAYKITATLVGGPTVTVWAQASSFSVNVAGPGTPYSGGCGPTGSRFPVGKPPAGAGPGTPPDCGVLWQAPTTGAALTATVRWTVTWGVGDLNGPGPNVLPPIVVTGPAHVVPVNEIQSVNGG
jgi:hypothetical protein